MRPQNDAGMLCGFVCRVYNASPLNYVRNDGGGQATGYTAGQDPPRMRIIHIIIIGRCTAARPEAGARWAARLGRAGHMPMDEAVQGSRVHTPESII